MTEAYRPGDLVMALYFGDNRKDSGWFNAMVVRLEPDGSYVVRWIPTREDHVARWHSAGDTRPPTSVVDPEDIRRRT
jgi:hypothetical protein